MKRLSKIIFKSFLKTIYVKSVAKLVSKELNHVVAILHVYVGGLNFRK